MRIFTQEIIVAPQHIDIQKRVSNLCYVQWMQDLAINHSTVQGWGVERYEAEGHGWVVRQHTITYKRPALAGDVITAATWVAELASRLPSFLASLSGPLGKLRRRLLILAARLPDGMAEAAIQWLERFFAGSSGLADSVSGWLLRFVTGTLSSVPEIGLFLLTTLLSAYLISTELPRLCAALSRHLPERSKTRAEALWTRLKAALGGYLKAQIRLMGVTFLIVSAGLLILRQEHALLLAAVIALVDALPGLLRGDTFTGIGLLLTYGAASLTRSALEPRFLGRQIGLSPLLTLVSLYAGFRLYGILGMILLPVAVILCRQIYELMEPPAEKQA